MVEQGHDVDTDAAGHLRPARRSDERPALRRGPWPTGSSTAPGAASSPTTTRA